jgi:hypothetical protein
MLFSIGLYCIMHWHIFIQVQSIFTLIKKEKNFFLINKEIQKGAVAKSHMTNDLLIYDFATAPI